MNGIQTGTLIFLITGAIDGIRNLPTMALFGNSLLFFFIAASLLFLIPVALISAALSVCSTKQGGIFVWVKMAFGDKAAFVAVWLQWINTLIWLPTIFSFLAGTSAYLFHPEWANNKYYLISIMLVINISLTWLNLKGIQVSARISSICAIVGTMLPILFILVLGGIWIIQGHPLQLEFGLHHLLPDVTKGNNWVALTAILTSFLGIELAAVHVRDIHHPQRTFPIALGISVCLVMVTMLFGALTIAFVLPYAEIGLVNGIGETFSYFLNAFHLRFLLPIIILLMLMGSFGGMISWIISPTRGLLQTVESGYLPRFFAKVNENGAPSNLLITQSILAFLLSLGFLIIPSINSIYWFLTALSTQLYIMMYAIMFIAAIALLPHVTQLKNVFKIPGGRFGYLSVCFVGLISCFIALIVGFIPPEDNNLGTNVPYPMIFTIALIIISLPIGMLFLYRSRTLKRKANVEWKEIDIMQHH